MEAKRVILKAIEASAMIVASVLVFPLFVIIAVVTFVGAIVYIPFHVWTVVRQSVNKP